MVSLLTLVAMDYNCNEFELKTYLKYFKLVGDGAFCRADSKLLENHLQKEAFTIGMAMTKIHCTFHGHNCAKNAVWKRSIFNSDNSLYWTGANEPNIRECK